MPDQWQKSIHISNGIALGMNIHLDEIRPSPIMPEGLIALVEDEIEDDLRVRGNR